jgi:hypothetical protein
MSWDVRKRVPVGLRVSGPARRSGRVPLRDAVLAAALLWIAASPVAGQQAVEPSAPDTTGYVLGHVRDDSTGQPVPAALVSLPALERRTVTDMSGRFEFAFVPAGTYTLRVRHIRYGNREVRLTVEPGEDVGVELAFTPRAIALEPLEVSVEALNPDLVGTGFHRRKMSGIRGFFADEEFTNGSAWSYRTVGEGLRQTREVRINMMGGNGCVGPILLNGRPYEPGYVHDYFRDLAGIEIYAAGDVPPDLLESLEAYRKATRGLSRHPAAGDGEDVYRLRPGINRCGIILLWTDRDGEVFGEEER